MGPWDILPDESVVGCPGLRTHRVDKVSHAGATGGAPVKIVDTKAPASFSVGKPLHVSSDVAGRIKPNY